MRRETPDLEALLTELGAARAEGVFERTGRGSLPWRTNRPISGRQAASPRSWRRAMTGLAAAAVLGFALVGIWRLESFWSAGPQLAQNPDSTALASRDVAPAMNADSSQAPVLPVDFNGDGVVDGDDIQGFVNSQETSSGSIGSRDASDVLARRLLGLTN